MDIGILYDATRHRYRGVYPCKRRWRAVVKPPLSSYVYLGVFPSPEEAARVVLRWYVETFGESAEDVIRNRSVQPWSVRRVKRSSALTVWVVVVWGSKVNRKVTPDMIGCNELPPTWSVEGEGWVSKAAALVAARLYRELTSLSSASVRCPTGSQPSRRSSA